MATLTAAYYPYNDTSIDEPQRDHLKQLADFAEDQNLEDDLRNYVRGITIAFTAFAAFVVGLRFLARHLQAARYLIDDYLMLSALVVLIGNMAMNLILVEHGMGLHSGRLTLEELQWLDKTMIGAEVLYVNGVNIYKIALLFLYLRIFPMPEVRKGAWICGSMTSLWTFACVIAASIQCIPLSTLWEPWKPGTCINLFLTQLCIAIPSIIVDIAILYLPIPHVLKLQMNRAQRILVLFTFLLGSYVVFTSIYRFRIFLNYTKDDVPYSLAEGLAWNIIEISSGIVSACLPTLGPIVRVLWKGLLDTAQRSGLDRYGRSSNKKSTGRSAGVTIGGGNGGGGQSGTASHARSGSKDWSKLSDSKGGSGNKSHIREEAKYGIGLETMGGGGGGDGSNSSLHSSPRGSNDIELMPQSAHSVTVKSPGRKSFPEGDQGNPSTREQHRGSTREQHRGSTREQHRGSPREQHRGSRLSKRGGRGTYPHHDNRIWQHREVEITTEPVEPESMLPEPNRKRISGIN